VRKRKREMAEAQLDERRTELERETARVEAQMAEVAQRRAALDLEIARIEAAAEQARERAMARIRTSVDEAEQARAGVMARIEASLREAERLRAAELETASDEGPDRSLKDLLARERMQLIGADTLDAYERIVKFQKRDTGLELE
jgi:malonyl CoA-acyl carrier protein transacylase